MTLDKINRAEEECKEMMKRIDAVKQRYIESGQIVLITGCNETGALRRQSMELSQALIDLRKA